MSALLRFHRKIIFALKKNQELANHMKTFLKAKILTSTLLSLFWPPQKDTLILGPWITYTLADKAKRNIHFNIHFK